LKGNTTMARLNRRTVSELGFRYIGGWLDSAQKKKSGGLGGASDPHAIFLQGQQDGSDPQVKPEAPVRMVAPGSLEEAIVRRMRCVVRDNAPAFYSLETGPQSQMLYRGLEKLCDEVDDEGGFQPITDLVKVEVVAAPEPEPVEPPADMTRVFRG
jgi:hypothetical protein